ncbi:ANTAR domain-containing protein [Pseudonocardia xinjiangensis]|nr:ANTAR domain-containing protein [Pseudonocardia xinjiangensis]
MIDAMVPREAVTAQRICGHARIRSRWGRTDLRAALALPATIDQAIGIVIAGRCSVEDAFATLRAASQRRNVKLRVVAGELVEAAQRSA